jgi:ddrB-like ParB superfamily domain
MPFDPSTAQPLDTGASSPAPSGKFDPSTATLAESDADQPQSFMDKMRAAAGSVGHLINPLEPFSPEKLEAGPRMLDALTFLPHMGAQGGAILGSLARGDSLDEAVNAADLVPSFTQGEAKTPVGKAIDTGMAVPGDVARELGRESEDAAKTYQKLGMGGFPVPFMNVDVPPEVAGAGGETIANAAMLALGAKGGEASGLLPWEQRVRAAPERIIPEPKDLPGASTAPPPLQLTHKTDIAQGDPVGQQVKTKAKDLVAMASEAAAAATKPPPASPIPAPAAPPATIGTGGGTTPPPPPQVAAALHAATGGDKAKMAAVIDKATGGNLKPGEAPENLADMAHAAIQQTPTGSGAPLPPSTPLNIAPVPLAGGVLHTTGGPEIAIDPRMPAMVTVPHAQTGAPVQVDTHTGVKAHESVEWPLMHLYAPLTDADLAGVASRAGLKSPDELPAPVVAKLRKGEALTYPEAHDIATLSENHHYATQYGVNPEHVQKAMTDGINAAKAQAPGEAVPPTLDTKPYVDDNQTHLLPGAQPAPPVAAAPLKPTPAEPVKPTGNPITDRFATQLQDFDKARADYGKLEDSKGGTVLNTDTAREMSTDYLADRTKSPDVHEPASAFIKKLYAAKLSEPTPAGMEPTVLFTGGGTGAGKSTGLAKLESDFKPEITYDTNMNTYASARQKIEQALDAGRKVKILYTYRDPAEALRNGALPRAMNQAKKHGSGRTLTLETHAQTHEGSFDVVHRLSREYNGDGRVEIVVVDNSRGKGNSEIVPLDQIPDPRSEDLRARLEQQLEEAHASGEISDSVYAGFGGKGGSKAGVGAGDRGQLEPQRGQVTAPPRPSVPEAAPDLMQNRDRGRAASVAQMTSIANTPDASRLSFSRDSNTGAPMVSAEKAFRNVPAMDQGDLDHVTFADGRKIPVRYAVVEAGDVQASHSADGTTNPAYAGAKLKALNNGRVAGVQAAYAKGEPGETYKRDLLDEAKITGIDKRAIADKTNPMIIRLYDAEHNKGDMGAASNANQALGLGPVEQAKTDARALPDLSSLPINESGELSMSPANPFYRDFLRNLGGNEAAKLVDSNGSVNKQFFDRLKSAIFAKAYGNERMLTAMAEDADPDARNVINALVRAAPEWSKVDPDGPLGIVSRDIGAAFDVLRGAREAGMSVDQFIRQGDLLGRDTSGDRWARFFADNTRSPRRMAEALAHAGRLVQDEQANEGQGQLIPRKPRTAQEITEEAIAKTEERNAPQQTGQLFSAAGRARPEADAGKPARRGDQVREQKAGPGSAVARSPGDRGSARTEVDEYPEGEPLHAASIAPSLSDFSDLAHKAIPDLDKIVDDALTKIAPMAAGSDEARATAKDFANEMRLATHEGNVADDMLKKNFTREQQTRMWQAADEQSVMEQSGEGVQSGKGMSTLSPEEAKAVRALQAKARKVYEQARDLGMVEGEGLPSYTPRMVVVMAEGGPRPPGADSARAKGGTGANVRTTTGSLKERKHRTTAETQAAARARFDETAKVVQNIRTLPLATARLARAVAGRTLINRIKEIGAQTGTDTVREGSAPNDGHTWFTLDHPSFQTWRPRFEDGEDGKVRAVTDTEGNPVFDKIPLYVRGDFKGPLKAIMSEEQGPIYRGLMQLKAKTMTVVMYSPLIHNAVEWGRALPAVPSKVATFRIYVEGNRAKHDPATMREAIKAGLVPIGHGGAMQDITGIEQGDQVAPGRSWTAQLLAAFPKLFERAVMAPGASDLIKHAIDKFGDFWHNTLLWDRVADLQMGLYTNMRDAMVRKGMTPETAQRIAAHLANRYAGALPKEAMSSAAQKLANVLMFSRTFTLGNIGAMKDALTGLPRDVAAQIKRDAPEEAEKAKTYAKRKALGIIAVDIALMYAGNSILQSAVSMMTGASDLEEEEKEYLARAQALMQRVKENPMDMLHPFDALQSLSSTSKNEPGKQDRVLVGHADDGTAIYMRNPVGKIGEEFVGWLSSPLDKMRSKVSTLARPAVETITNDKGFGRKVYDPYDNAPGAAVRNIGRIAANIMGDQVPLQAIQAAKDYYDGVGDARLNLSQVFGPLAGLTFSKGAPGGEAVGELYAAKEEQKFKVDEAMPGIRKHIQAGDVDGAIDTMQGLGMSPSYIKWVVMTTQDPSLRISKRAMQDFDKYATPEERERMDRALGKAPPQ